MIRRALMALSDALRRAASTGETDYRVPASRLVRLIERGAAHDNLRVRREYDAMLFCVAKKTGLQDHYHAVPEFVAARYQLSVSVGFDPLNVLSWYAYSAGDRADMVREFVERADQATTNPQIQPTAGAFNAPEHSVTLQ